MNHDLSMRLTQAAGCLSPPIYGMIRPYFSELENKAQEIRLRLGRPLSIVCPDQTFFITRHGSLNDLPCGDLVKVSREEMQETFERLCDYSVYAHRREIVNGFITLRGGHRAGICGTAVTDKNGMVNVRDISSVNIRIAREHKGCSEVIFKAAADDFGGLMLCGAPCSGKTTLLRDLARTLSLSERQNVSLIDERGELAATTSGEAQNDVGLCDVFDGYPKAQAMEQALRTMSPQVIVCDEIGSREDVRAVRLALNSGVRIIAAAHARTKQELFARDGLRELLATGAFSTVIFLHGRNRAGEVREIFRGERLVA